MEYAREMVDTGRVGVNQVCRLLGLSKKSFYQSLSPDESLEQRYGYLKPKVELLIEKNPAYGYRRLIKALWDDFGIIVNHKLLVKLLKTWALGLKRHIRKPKRGWVHAVLDFLEYRAKILWQMIRRNMINGCFQVIVSDVTEIHYQGAKAWLCVHMDYFGKMVYGWSLGRSPDSSLVVDSFRRASGCIKQFLTVLPRWIVFHQDRGSIYTGNAYVTTVLDSKFRLSYSRTGEPGDNAVNESFFSRLKDEWRDVFIEARTFEELEVMVKNAIDYYNNTRYHSAIGMMPPAAFTMKHVAGLTLSHDKAVS